MSKQKISAEIDLFFLRASIVITFIFFKKTLISISIYFQIKPNQIIYIALLIKKMQPKVLHKLKQQTNKKNAEIC